MIRSISHRTKPSSYMAQQRVATDSTFKLPACDYALEDMGLKEWSVTIGDEEAVSKQPGDEIIVTADTTVTAVWKALEPVKAPQADPAGGTYVFSKTVALTSETKGAEIWYTTDGSDPTNAILPEGTAIPVSNSNKYTEPISVKEDTTIRARAYKDGMAKSEITEAVYTFVAPVYSLEATAPVFEPGKIGYTQPAPMPLTLTNNGNTAVTIKDVYWSGDQAEVCFNGYAAFDLPTIAPGTADNTTYTFQPKAGLGLGTYTIYVTVLYNDNRRAETEVSFTVREPDPCEVKISVQKELSSREWNADDVFEFTIAAEGETPVPTTPKVTVTNDSVEKTEAFGSITITEPGTYTWTISETHGGETFDGIQYDAEKKSVTVTVENKAGSLIAAQGSTLTPEVSFANTFVGCNVKVTAGTGMTKTENSGETEQTRVTGAIADVVFTADNGWYFPEDYSVEAQNGITVTRDSFTQITVSGTPTADTEITLPVASEKTKPEAPTGKQLEYSGKAQKLVTVGEAIGETVLFAIGEDATTAPTENWSASIPTATDAGTYYVWYRVIGDASHLDTEAACITASIVMPVFGDPDFVMPGGLTAIEESAFEGVTSMKVVDAHSCAAIGQGAFKGAGLEKIRLPMDCEIDDAAFDQDGSINVFAPSGGSTQAYCTEHDNLIFIAE